ncbi:glycosyltransferase family A protein [uncultured Faecalibaculum sp.]|uniref:glycosyltransferase family 2 protein n=1 Tax=uncultured Faecalibaculum sp. TaxID=1729681 RepID=UPI00272E3845|nr:glycosyltransferase family A protein [uncultured Faecalibaculum sp.]
MENSNSGVSILIPAYNAAEYIDKTLQSIFSQTYQDFEVVIVDDGSTDDTLAVLNQWKKRYPDSIQIQSKENSGVSDTRNVLLSLARRKYLTFLDSDDYLDQNYLEVLTTTAENNHADMVISGQRKVTPQGEVITTIHYPVDKYPLTAMRRLNFAGKLYRREFVLKSGVHFQKKNLYEDNPFNLALMTIAKNLQILSYEGYNQIVHIGSITAKKITNELVPYTAIEETIQLVVSHKDQVEDFDLFVYTLLSFFTFFIFKANKNHSYMKMDKARTSNIDTVLKFVRFSERIIKRYGLNFSENRYRKRRYTKDLPLSQKLGVKLFYMMLKSNSAESFVKLYYQL